ncbi:MAG: hypothetical protein WCR56_03985 [Bacilli bacterium]|jgi:hypothetical protein
MEENNQNTETTQPTNAPVEKKPEPKKTFLDFNASWPLMLVYLGFLIGMFYAQKSTYTASGTGNTYSYTFVSLIIGLLVTFLVYNLGKIVFASLAGYKISYISILGILFDNSGKKVKVSYDIMAFFDAKMQFVPKDDDIKKNPHLIFIGGFIFELVLVALCVALFFILSFQKDASTSTLVGWYVLFGAIYGLVLPLYEALPFRQDSATDMFNLLITASSDDKMAFNIVKVNERRELSGEDFLIPNFADYDSYYKAQTLYPLYLSYLYSNQLEKAVAVLDEMKRLNKDLPEEDRYLSPSESIFLRYLIDDTAGADKMYMMLSGDDKKAVTTPIQLANYRTSLLVLGNITSDIAAINDLLNKFNKKINSAAKSDRIEKENNLFIQAYSKLKANKPNLGLKDLK